MAKEFVGENRLIQLIDLIYNEVNKYQKAVSGKGLSTEDFTTELKTKLEGIDDDIDSAIADALKDVTGLSFSEKYASYEQLVAQVTAPQNGVIYLVANGSNSDEYYWDGSKFELFGSTSVDLNGYLKDSDVIEISAATVLAKWQAKFGA